MIKNQKRMSKPKYKIYPSLLDSYTDYLNSDSIWEQYWGNSETTPHTPEIFKQKQYQSLIDKINRVPAKWEETEKRDKGTAFNEVVDCIIEHRKSKDVNVEILYKLDDKGNITKNIDSLKVDYNKRCFIFPYNICNEFATYFKGAITQLYVESTISTCYGDVLLYGYIDELMSDSVHDIKTTGRYSFGKFKDHTQHLVYPYCLLNSGNNIHHFEYDITDFKETYKEEYVFDEKRDIPILRKRCEDFIEFINENKSIIIDKKIFGGEKDA